MKYRFLPHTADSMFEAYGKSLEELFENSALAVEEIMVNIKTIKVVEEYEITLENVSEEGLLYDFLSELIFIKDTESLLFKEFEIIIHHKNKKYELFAKCKGEYIDRERHQLLDDAKAITKHDFEIKKDDYYYKTKIIVDI